MKSFFRAVAVWYRESYELRLKISAGIFALQLVHLVWLLADIILPKLLGTAPVLAGSSIFHLILIFVDYLEIPTIISVSLIYIETYRREGRKKDLLYLLLLNTQWLHILWITDEFVVQSFVDRPESLLPPILAWLAIGIDYLELPVIYDTLKRVFQEGWAGFKEEDEVPATV